MASRGDTVAKGRPARCGLLDLDDAQRAKLGAVADQLREQRNALAAAGAGWRVRAARRRWFGGWYSDPMRRLRHRI
jgi:hypothetical protein